MQINKNIRNLISYCSLSLLITTGLISQSTKPVIAANGITTSVESVFVPLGRNGTNDTRSITLLYGIKGFSEFGENWRLSYGVSGTVLNGFLASFPVSVAFVPTGDYKTNLRPQIFAGIEPFYSNFPDFSGFKIYGHVGLGLDYMVNDNFFINVGAKAFINDSFFKDTKNIKTTDFNTGVLSVYGGVGYKFL